MTTTLALNAVSYSIVGAAEAAGVSERTIRAAIKADNLVAHYLGSKPLIRAVDLDEWVNGLPTEKESA